MPKIHPTAIVDENAKLADDVVIGPYCIVENNVTIGQGTVLRRNVILRQYTSLGKNNLVDSFSVLGGEPQDMKFTPETTSHVRIGDNNVFREHVTVSRATGEDNATVIGNNTYWMDGAHAGHNAEVHDAAVLVNGSALGGYAIIGRSTTLAAHVSIHQFTWIGDMVTSQGNAIGTSHVPPYVILAGRNQVVGLNTTELRRASHIGDEYRRQIKEAFSLTYRAGMGPPKALEKMDACTDWGEAAGKFREFIRRVLTAEKPYNRGLCPLRHKAGRDG